VNVNADLERRDALLFPLGVEFVKAREHFDSGLDTVSGVAWIEFGTPKTASTTSPMKSRVIP
jgi:hypothetical protein